MVNGRTGLVGNPVQPHPDKHRTSDVVALKAFFPALATLEAGCLLDLSMSLLNLPANGALFLCIIGCRLSLCVANNIVRALGRERYTEQTQVEVFGKIFDMNTFVSYRLRL